MLPPDRRHTAINFVDAIGNNQAFVALGLGQGIPTDCIGKMEGMIVYKVVYRYKIHTTVHTSNLEKITYLESDSFSIEPSDKNRFWSPITVKSDHMRSDNLRIGLIDHQVEIHVRIAMSRPCRPGLPQSLHFSDGSRYANFDFGWDGEIPVHGN